MDNQVDHTLAKPDLHEQWVSAYYTPETQRLFEQIFDFLAQLPELQRRATFLDAGCGNGVHSIRLAKRGYSVVAIDFSEYVLEKAKINVAANGLKDRVMFQRGSLLELEFPDHSFDYVLCWGVLTHIPDLERAISELSRVVKPGGVLIVEETNMYSIESLAIRSLRRLLGRSLLRRVLGKEPASLTMTPAGAERWKQTSAGPLIVREANIAFLIDSFNKQDFSLIKRLPSTFTELYAAVKSHPIQYLACRVNEFWFRYLKILYLACGNILVLKKNGEL